VRSSERSAAIATAVAFERQLEKHTTKTRNT